MSTSILSTIQSQLNFYCYLIPMILGNVGNIFIIILFTRQRKNACSIYLISSAIVNNIYLIFTGYAQIFPFYYADQTTRAFFLCKIRSYIPSVLGLLTKTLIAFACIDRFMVTNKRASFRALSTRRKAKSLIFFSILFWPVCNSHIAIMTTIINGQCGQFGTYSTIFTIYIIILVGLIPPIILGLFGYLTYQNMIQRYVRVQPAVRTVINAHNCIRRRDRELLIIVIYEILFYVITATPYPFILLEMMISRYIISNKSIQYLQIESFILSIAFILLYLNFAAPYYIYLMASKAFRRDFKRLIISIYPKLRRQPIMPTVSGTTHHMFT
ncbi:unnamed protein product [Rotaria sp. Silwood1]|nr:unnamed protein product [Rotaria sp. Silwood1]CAF1597882.1 unnamed protein product [Rotaria sp. Silwood1]CAF3691430.1 unnamed protein product [Rotaria sp. Silwood1]CAF3715943.1 unnamed protein product [Rotaria sp. Silwood1]CAF4605962.1 unnamed protein product [Rotaria sp. Silwood1]